MSAASATQTIQDLNIPIDLRELDRWVLWRMEIVDGRQTKVPYSVVGYRASSTNPRDWAPFEEALSAWLQE